jgi:hypothetical protein
MSAGVVVVAAAKSGADGSFLCVCGWRESRAVKTCGLGSQREGAAAFVRAARRRAATMARFLRKASSSSCRVVSCPWRPTNTHTDTHTSTSSITRTHAPQPLVVSASHVRALVQTPESLFLLSLLHRARQSHSRPSSLARLISRPPVVHPTLCARAPVQRQQQEEADKRRPPPRGAPPPPDAAANATRLKPQKPQKPRCSNPSTSPAPPA